MLINVRKCVCVSVCARVCVVVGRLYVTPCLLSLPPSAAASAAAVEYLAVLSLSAE